MHGRQLRLGHGWNRVPNKHDLMTARYKSHCSCNQPLILTWQYTPIHSVFTALILYWLNHSCISLAFKAARSNLKLTTLIDIFLYLTTNVIQHVNTYTSMKSGLSTVGIAVLTFHSLILVPYDVAWQNLWIKINPSLYYRKTHNTPSLCSTPKIDIIYSNLDW